MSTYQEKMKETQKLLFPKDNISLALFIWP